MFFYLEKEKKIKVYNLHSSQPLFALLYLHMLLHRARHWFIAVRDVTAEVAIDFAISL